MSRIRRFVPVAWRPGAFAGAVGAAAVATAALLSLTALGDAGASALPAAPARSDVDDPDGTDAGDTEGAAAGQPAPDGELLYLTGCANCHAADGSGVDDWPDIRNSGAAAADFMLRTGRMPLANPTPQAPAKPPAYDDAEIRAIVDHVASLGGGPAIPDADPDLGDLAAGGELYRANCAACHNAAGIGGALSGGELAPSLRHTAPTQIAEAIRVGPGQMPRFSEATLTDHEVNSILAYVEYLREPESPGGAALGGAGPLSEGFVAVLFGLGVLVWACRWITREHGEPRVEGDAVDGAEDDPDGDGTAGAAPGDDPADRDEISDDQEGAHV